MFLCSLQLRTVFCHACSFWGGIFNSLRDKHQIIFYKPLSSILRDLSQGTGFLHAYLFLAAKPIGDPFKCSFSGCTPDQLRQNVYFYLYFIIFFFIIPCFLFLKYTIYFNFFFGINFKFGEIIRIGQRFPNTLYFNFCIFILSPSLPVLPPASAYIFPEFLETLCLSSHTGAYFLKTRMVAYLITIQHVLE